MAQMPCGSYSFVFLKVFCDRKPSPSFKERKGVFELIVAYLKLTHVIQT